MSLLDRLRPNRPLDCRAVAKVLQQFLDDESDELTARRVAAHLDDCLRCGMEADTYLAIKASLAGAATPLDDEAAHRLRTFGAELLDDPPEA